MSDEGNVLDSKRSATRYRILVEIAERQPAVSQQEIADEVGVTAQAVSDYLQGLVADGYVEKHGRGRYEITKEGVDWLISQTDGLRDVVRYVSEDVIGQVEVETALATARIEEGQPVTVSMRDGVLRATPGDTGGASAVAVTDADEGEDVGLTDFEGILDFETGRVTVVPVPRVQNGGSAAVDERRVADAASGRLVAVAGTEAIAAADGAGVEADMRFGTPCAVEEAATKGLDVLLVAVEDRLSEHTDRLRENDISYELIDVKL